MKNTVPAHWGNWEVVIGLETHAQLSTVSKIFSGAATRYGAAPNTQACVVDLALPGTLPVLNRAAVECAIRFGLAVGATVAPRSVFARKNYFYPDLPKGYQISQFGLPVVVGGAITLDLGGSEKTIRLTRAHLEEDAGKSLHEGLDTAGVSGIDLNRAGTPLLEIVSEPDMRSAAEAVAYARRLHALVTWIGICDGNMQEGSFRCDANISVRPAGESKLGTRCEVKNVNSFRFLERAIQYEIRRQIELIEDGGQVVQETRLYDADRDETRSMRSKEDAMDYRYFPDPDLPPLVIDSHWIDTVRATLPELPGPMAERFVSTLGLPHQDAALLTASRATARYFEALLAEVGHANAKLAANWVLGELSALLNERATGFEESPVTSAQLARLLQRVIDGTVSAKSAKELLRRIADGEGNDPATGEPTAQAADLLIEKLGLRQVSDAGAIDAFIDTVLAENPKSVAEFKAGKEKAFQALVGQVIRASRGKANPAQVNEALKKRLA